MMIPHLSERELAFLRLLASEFAKGKIDYFCNANEMVLEGQRIEPGEIATLIYTMQGCGAVERAVVNADKSLDFRITPASIQLVREMSFQIEMEKRETERRQTEKEADRRYHESQRRSDKYWQLLFTVLSAALSLIGGVIGYYLRGLRD